MKRQFLIVPTALMLALAGSVAIAQNETLDYDDAYGMIDDNHDGNVSQTEFTEYFTTTDYFIGWDVDGDGQLSTDEVATGLDANDDGMIDDNELEVVLFRVYDANNDEIIKSDEWTEFPAYAGGAGNAHTPPIEE